ncbi:MAG: hypothetical protein P9L93_05045 [Candidatus Gorgyraea atricola]|nr:hypothetical protein [Candidatus Gorgyraea atricola]
MLIKILRFIGSILLIPACVALTTSFYKGIISIKYVSESGILFILGALAYSVLHLVFVKLDFLYVLGHELTHAIATFFSGGKVKGMKVSSRGGSIRTTTPNLFVALAPYLIPGYTVFIALLYFLLSFFTDVDRFSGIFIFLIGFTLMFHLSYTAQSIREKQSDLIKSGYLFSISFLYIVNLVIVFAIVSFLFNVSFTNFLSEAYEGSKQFYCYSWKQLFL